MNAKIYELIIPTPRNTLDKIRIRGEHIIGIRTDEFQNLPVLKVLLTSGENVTIRQDQGDSAQLWVDFNPTVKEE
ncbi:MAG: hypothetical protein RIC84_08855 [Aggregatilineales bacterium]